jgi:hypothetical protein
MFFATIGKNPKITFGQITMAAIVHLNYILPLKINTRRTYGTN